MSGSVPSPTAPTSNGEEEIGAGEEEWTGPKEGPPRTLSSGLKEPKRRTEPALFLDTTGGTNESSSFAFFAIRVAADAPFKVPIRLLSADPPRVTPPAFDDEEEEEAETEEEAEHDEDDEEQEEGSKEV